MKLFDKLTNKSPRTAGEILGSLVTMKRDLAEMAAQRRKEIGAIENDLVSEGERHEAVIAEENKTHAENVDGLNTARSTHQEEVNTAEKWIAFFEGSTGAPAAQTAPAE